MMNPIIENYKKRYEEMVRCPWNFYMDPFRIVGNLFFVGNTDGASHILDTGEGLILFDTNFPTTSALLIHSIWKAGFDPADIRMIFHTHGHYDHFGSTELIKALSGAKTYLGAKDAKMFLEKPELALLDFYPGLHVDLFVPDYTLNDNETIRLGNTEIRALDTEGHSPGAMSYLFDVHDGNKRYKAILHGGAGFITLSKEFEETYNTSGNKEKFMHSLERLKAIDADIFLGNHTYQNKTAEKRKYILEHPDEVNPFINNREWHQYLEKLEAELSVFCDADKE